MSNWLFNAGRLAASRRPAGSRRPIQDPAVLGSFPGQFPDHREIINANAPDHLLRLQAHPATKEKLQGVSTKTHRIEIILGPPSELMAIHRITGEDICVPLHPPSPATTRPRSRKRAPVQTEPAVTGMLPAMA